MTKNCRETLDELGFVPAGRIEPKGDNVVELTITTNDSRPGVYVWVKRDKEGRLAPAYVGKAGKGLKVRFGQHHQGFRGPQRGGSATGEKYLRRLQDVLATGVEMLIYFRPAGMQVVFGVEVSSISIEEEAAIKRLSPLWNDRAKNERAAEST